MRKERSGKVDGAASMDLTLLLQEAAHRLAEPILDGYVKLRILVLSFSWRQVMAKPGRPAPVLDDYLY